jgi:glycosyltransferase involved in cell wall biosynthesis
VDAGHVVRIITFERPGEQPAFELDRDVEVEPLDLLKPSATFCEAVRNNVHRITALRRQLGCFAPDVSVAQAAIPSILTIVAGIGRPWPTVATEHTHPAFHRLSRSWEHLRRIAYPLADEIVVPTQDVATWFGSALHLSAQVMPNPVDLSKFGARSVSRERQQSQRRRLIAVGRLAPEKRYDLLIHAFARSAKLEPAWDLVIYGEGPERAALEILLDSLGLSGRVDLAGSTSNVEQAYADADIFVHTAEYEGYGNAVQEALAAGKPVIATDSPGVARQLLRDGRYGILVPNADVDALARALSALMADGDRRALLARTARDAVLPFEVGLTAERWIEMFRRLIEQAHRRRVTRILS